LAMMLRRMGRLETIHGMRSSFRDWTAENGWSRELAERALAHVVNNDTEAAYFRTDLLEQRRSLMEAWSKFLTEGRQLLIHDSKFQTE
jgi:integrase